MKKIIVTIILLFSTMTIACEPDRYNVHYLPIEAEFYMPPTREYIMQYGTKIELVSCILTSLFESISVQDGIEPQIKDYKALRIMIVNTKNGRELFITADKIILSNGKKYDIDVGIIGDVLREVTESK